MNAGLMTSSRAADATWLHAIQSMASCRVLYALCYLDGGLHAAGGYQSRGPELLPRCCARLLDESTA